MRMKIENQDAQKLYTATYIALLVLLDQIEIRTDRHIDAASFQQKQEITL